MNLKDKRIVVVGASRGLGRQIALGATAQGAQTLAVARGQEGLRRLEGENPSIATLALDATLPGAPDKVLDAFRPNVLVHCGGEIPPMGSVQDLDWERFSHNWQTDVKASFGFVQAALRRPLEPGSVVLIVASGAAVAGSPISGGYAGAKRMQMFLAMYGQTESDRHGLGIRFASIAPMRIMPETDLGRAAAEGYARYRGETVEELVAGMEGGQAVADVVAETFRFAAEPLEREGVAFGVSGHGVERLL